MSLAVTSLPTTALRTELLWAIAQARPPRVRPISRWVEEEIILPNGPFAGERYRHSRHPVSRLWFGELDSGKWSRFAATGPTQNGKSLMCYVAPVLYHLFEIGETTIIGLPDMNMAGDKWEQDFKPVIEASAYRDLMPLKGEGSKGGQVKRAVTFRNGAMLRFMSGGGSDKKRAGFTARVAAITEADGMDEAGEASREADKIEQIEGRTRAFGRTGKRIYLECTVSIEAGRIWQELITGTDSRIARPCPHCGEYVVPEREHLVGWESAASEGEAADLAFWACPSCGQAWTEEERRDAATKAVLVHRGQTVLPSGEVIGEPVNTQTLGFRWSAIDNPFITAADLGAEEWKAKRSKDRENAEKKMRQFVWTLPYLPPDIDLTPLDHDTLQGRINVLKRGVLPAECFDIAVGVDTGKRQLNWEAKAVCEDGSKAVIDYGEQPVEADKLGVYRGLLEAFRKLRAFLDAGWGGMRPGQVWIDSGYHEHTDAVYALCAEANAGMAIGQERYRPSKGYGEGQIRIGRYTAPNSRSKDVVYIGKEYHIAKVRRNGKVLPGVLLVHVNSDHWKSEFHQGLLIPDDQPGAITVFTTADIFEHSDYFSQLIAEKQVEKFFPGRGSVAVWERIDRNNHKLDAGYLATAAGDFLLQVRSEKAKPRPEDRPSARDLARAAKGQ